MSSVGLAMLLGALSAQSPQSASTLQVEDFAALPITGDPAGENTRGQLARVNYLRQEPGGQRFFVNDLNGPLYILDPQTKAFTTYLDFNGLAGRPGLFPRFTFERNFATGLTSFVFDPDYVRNGVFYTLHMEDPAVAASAAPKAGVLAGLNLTGYETTPPITSPTVDGRIDREVVLIEWTDRNPRNATFEGSARELLRLQHPLPQHPLGDMTFNPAARPGDPDWRVMYLGAGDSGSGEQRDVRRFTPQRLDTLLGKILRIVPDLRAHTGTSAVSANGRYRIPRDNPFLRVSGARPEIWAYGLRNPHRLIWANDPRHPSAPPHLLAFNIGLVTWETVILVKKGANYGYPLREGTQAMTAAGMQPVPAEDVIPMHVSDTDVRGTVAPTYPVLQYRHTPAEGGDAIANGFVYDGKAIPALRGKLVFGDITTGRLWYTDIADVLAADDGRAESVAPLHVLDADLRALVERTWRARGGKGEAMPGRGVIAGRGRVDMRFAVDANGELYILTKTDGMIRKVTGASLASVTREPDAGTATRNSVSAATAAPTTMKNPVAATAESIASGRQVYATQCAPCHGPVGQGAVRAGTPISIIEEQRGKQPPDLTDSQWDHGETDGEVFTVIKRGVPPTMMAGYDGRISDTDIWHIVNYLRTLRARP